MVSRPDGRFEPRAMRPTKPGQARKGAAARRTSQVPRVRLDRPSDRLSARMGLRRPAIPFHTLIVSRP